VLRGDITRALRSAVLEELAAVGYGRFSIEAVARRAGVGKTAVYRRWHSKLDMVLEVVSGPIGRRLRLPDTGSLAGDVAVLVNAATAALHHPLASQIIPDLLAEAARTPQLARTLGDALRANQRHVGDVLVSRAVARGELPAGADPEVAVDLVVGPVYWRLAIARTPLPDGYADTLAAAVTAALRPVP
jgi:AcrR family transcriptional regulator